MPKNMQKPMNVKSSMWKSVPAVKGKLRFARPASLLALLSLVGATSTPAATATKQASGTDLTGNTAAVWSGGSGANGAPGSGDTAAWNSTLPSLGAGLILTNSVAWGGISVSGAASDISVTGGGTLTNGSSGISISSSTVNFLWGTPVILAASQAWVPNQVNGQTLTVSGNISGSGYTLTVGSTPKTGGGTQQGTLLLAGATNSFQSVAIQNGTLVLTNGQNTASTVTIFQWNNAENVNNFLYVTNGGTLIFSNLVISTQNSGKHVTPALYLDNGTLESGANATIAGGLPIYVNGGGATVNTTGGNFTNNSAFLHGSGTPDGGLTVTGGNVLALPSGSTYTGGTRINGGTVSLASGTALGSAGTIEFTGNSTLQWGSGVTTDLSGRLQVDDGITATIDTGANTVSFANALTLGTLGTGSLAKQGGGTLTLSAANTYAGNTTINAGTLLLGSSGSIAGSGNISVAANAVFDVSAVSGGFTLGAAQTLAGSGSVNGAVTANGSLLPGGASVGTLTFSNYLAINSNLVFKLNKSLVQSNDVINVLGTTLTNSGTGTLTVTNVGTVALAVADRFVLFSQPVSNGLALAIAGPAGVTFTNNLAVDGSLTVLAVPQLLGTNASLALLALNPPAGLLPGFAPGGYSYWMTNAYTNNPVTVTAGSQDTNATLSLSFNGGGFTPLTTGVASGNLTLTLNPPTNTVIVKAVSQDLSQTNSYTINVRLQPSQTVPVLANSLGGGTLTLNWPADHQGWVVQSNSVSLALTNDWQDVANTASGTNYRVTLNPAWTNVFYRLREP